ncbi:hypothetical protein [Microbacterium sp. 1.5R]|uniref:hypothetical protein n=1 Tax=Microbacterium sp. 1.5R TaxID=1916917 RepID=UPI0011AA5A2D|nr:hypothetical protein [Microbacterium sp. 1.5R]
MPRLSDRRRSDRRRSHRRPSDRRLIAALLGAALMLTGCSGSAKPADPVPSPTHIDLGAWDEETSGNGLVLLDAASARATILAAVREAGTATMTGTYTNGAGRTLEVEVDGSSEQTVAAFTIDGDTTTIVVSDGQAYVKPSTATATEDLEPGEFRCVADDDDALTRWGALLHPLQTIAEYTADASKLSAPSGDAVDLVLGADGTLGALAVSTEGSALPTTLTRADAAGALQLEFSGWGEEIDVPDLGSPAGC